MVTESISTESSVPANIKIKSFDHPSKYSVSDYDNIAKTIKDTECNLERTHGIHFSDTLKTIKDVEYELGTVTRDAESNIKDAVKDAELSNEKSESFTRDLVRQSELATEKTKGKLSEDIKNAEFRNEKSEGQTREMTLDKFYSMKASTDKMEQNLTVQMLHGFKDQALLSQQLNSKSDVESLDKHWQIKELVRIEGQATRELINKNQTDDLRAKLVRAEMQLDAYFIARRPPVVP
jgi:polyhydroxyalkanoate synthesis regulator phasin